MSPRFQEEPVRVASAPADTSGVRLRGWQLSALEKLERHKKKDFLAVATPGAGKTTFALTAVRHALVARRVRRVVVVVPTQHLKVQWAHAAEAFDIHLDPNWSSGYGALPSDVHGVAVTYQQVAANPQAMRTLVAGAMVVLDEIHHAADSRSWGDGARLAFEEAHQRLCLSGTPFRSDQSTIPFIEYAGDEARPDFEYGYADALRETAVVRPVYFPRINGRMEWTAPEGLTYNATFDDPLTKELANQRLRTALAANGDWLPAVLRKANSQLMHVRLQDPRAAGLVIAMDQAHARGIAALLYQITGRPIAIATSDDPEASKKIEQFSTGEGMWIVAVRMVSEGVDIPRLRVGVFATNTLTDLFFRQAVGRLVRWRGRLEKQAAYMFIPDDPRLRMFASSVAQARRHVLKKPSWLDDGSDAFATEELKDPLADVLREEGDGEEQVSLYSALSAVPLDVNGRPLQDNGVVEPEEGEPIPDLVDGPSENNSSFAADPWWSARLAEPVPAPEPVPMPSRDAAPVKSPLARRRDLREENSSVVRDLVHYTGRGHADVNAELNRKVGIKRISEATAKQLEKRLGLARAWLAKY